MRWHEHDRDAAARREASDANGRAIAWVGVGLAGFVALCMAGLWVILPEARRGDGDAEWIRFEPPGEIEHWIETRESLAARRRLSEERLGRLEWADRDAGVARIPIDEAMRLLVERGGEGARR